MIYGLLRTYQIFQLELQGCLPQIWLGSFLNTLTHISDRYISDRFKFNPTRILKGTIIAMYQIHTKVAGKSWCAIPCFPIGSLQNKFVQMISKHNHYSGFFKIIIRASAGNDIF